MEDRLARAHRHQISAAKNKQQHCSKSSVLAETAGTTKFDFVEAPGRPFNLRSVVRAGRCAAVAAAILRCCRGIAAGRGRRGRTGANEPRRGAGLRRLDACRCRSMWLIFRRKRRLSKFAKQLPDAMELIARALRAGHSLASGFNLVADEMTAPDRHRVRPRVRGAEPGHRHRRSAGNDDQADSQPRPAVLRHGRHPAASNRRRPGRNSRQDRHT